MFVLADARDWLSIWQLPVLGLLIVGWTLWGGRVMRKQVASVASRKESGAGRCTKIALLSCLAGLACAGIGAYMGKLIGNAMEIRWFWLGLPLGGLAFVAVSFLTVYASFQLPPGQLAKTWVKSFALVLVVTLAAAVPAFYMPYRANQRAICLGESLKDLSHIYRVLSFGALRAYPPKSLGELLEQRGFQPSALKALRHPQREIGYFYAPTQVIDSDQKTSRLLACDWTDNQPGGERVILMLNGQVDIADPDKFQSLLAKDENKAFAEALAAAEKKLLGSGQ